MGIIIVVSVRRHPPASSGDVLALPDFSVLRRQPRIPGTAKVVASGVILTSFGTTFHVTVWQSRRGADWWVAASLNGLRMSDTVHTRQPRLAAKWVQLVRTGLVVIK